MYNPFSGDFISGFTAAKLTFTAVIATIFGYVAKFLGGFDSLMVSFITLIVVDYVSGVVAAVYQKKLSSYIGFKGILKKFLMLLVVGVSVALSRIMPDALPLREITILFFVANEGLSVLENVAKIIPLPQKLKDVLLQLKDKSDSTTSDKSTQKSDKDSSKE